MPQDLAQPPVAVATAFVASDGEAAAFATAAEALAATEALRRAQPDAVIAVHVADRERPGAARARRLRDVGRPGQTLVSAAAAAALPAGAGAVALHDLGLHRLRDLSPPERVFALGAPGDEPLRSLDATPNNLPSHPTTFVGRDAELAELHDRLAQARLITITGPGGSGKTRLAAQLAADEASRRPDGAWWVELGDIADPGQVAESVAAALGVLVDPAQGTVALLRAQLASRRLLLCLDNCEHVLAAVADVAGALFAGCPEVAIVATSREPLGLTGELVWRLPPLPAREAHALFVERAEHVQPDLALDAEAGAAIDSMCMRLDGSPLALELAAAWLRTLTPRQIEAGLDDRFALLVRSPRDAVPRHASLLASMAWSHNLLDEDDRAVFRRLAVFPAGFDLEAARAVCGEDADALGALARLVDKSLVVADGARYRLPETIREYAADRLRAAGERRATTDRLLAHLLARLRDAAPLRDTDKDAWRAALAPEHDNLRAAIEHGLDAEDPEPARAPGGRAAVAMADAPPGPRGTGLPAPGHRPQPRRPLRRAGAAADRRRARRRHGRPAGPRVRRGAARPRAGRRARRRAPALALPGAGRRRALLHGLRRGMRAGARVRADRRAGERRVRDPRRAGAARDRRPPARRARRRAGAAGRRRRAPGSPRRPRRGRDRSRV